MMAMYRCSYLIAKSRPNLTSFWKFNSNIYILISFFVFSTFSAIRWRVGADCNSYMYEYYNNYSTQTEIGYSFLVKSFKLFELSHVPLFFTVAYIQIFLLYYSQRKHPEMLMFIPLVLFLSEEYFSFMNGMRQTIACCSFLVASDYYSNKRFIPSLTFILFATLFHKSAIILLLLLLIPIWKKQFLPNRYLQILIIIICFIFKESSLLQSMSGYIEHLITIAGYDESRMSILNEFLEKKFGLRSLCSLIASLIVVYHSDKIKSFINQPNCIVYYNLFYVGLCLSLLFFNNLGIERFIMYFTIFSIPMIAYACFYFYSMGGNYKKWLFLIIICLIIRFTYSLYAAGSDPNEMVLYKTIIGRDISGQ